MAGNNQLPLFDRFATWAADRVARAGFFILCCALVIIWAPLILVLPDLDTWQLIINTATTIITFLLVALLQNTTKRADTSTQTKDNAVAFGLAVLLDRNADQATRDRARRDLLDVVGLEQHASS